MPTLFKHFATPKQEDTVVTTIRQGYGDIICIYMISILFVIMNVDQVGSSDRLPVQVCSGIRAICTFMCMWLVKIGRAHAFR